MTYRIFVFRDGSSEVSVETGVNNPPDAEDHKILEQVVEDLDMWALAKVLYGKGPKRRRSKMPAAGKP